MDQSQLIHEYASCRSDDSFKALLDQYVGLVYSACFRQLKDRHLAEDATQAVFILLSQKATTLHQTYLSGWLLTTSRYACANIRRSQQRRKRHEQVVAMNPTSTTESPTHDLLDLLDDGLSHLKTADREALVLRYLKEQPLDDVAENLGVSPAAARKRVDRGIEKLRQYFSRRGITTTPAILGPILAEQFRGTLLTTAARHVITQTILEVCHAGPQSSAASIAIAKGTKTMMILTRLKTAAALAVFVAIIGTSGWMISRTLAGNSPAPQITTPVSASASVPPAAPSASASAIDLTTPDSAARSFFIALKNGDRTTAYACLTVDPNRSPTLMDAMLAWNLAQNHLVNAVAKSFGGDGSAVKQIVTLDEIAYAVAQSPDGTSAAVVDGDTATITTNIPEWLFKLAPENYQPILKAWSDKKLYFQKQGDRWKFDIDRSMRVIAKIVDRNQHQLDTTASIAVIMENAKVTEQVATTVADGHMDTAADAAKALNTARRRISKSRGISFADFDVVPAKDDK